jgi:flagellar hook-basal body complex protein FliE
MAVGPLTVSPAAAAQAYRSVETGQGSALASGTDFGSALARALDGAVATGRQADAQSAAAISGSGNITDVVTAVSKAELALQTTVAIRDRVVQAYQDIMRMPI